MAALQFRKAPRNGKPKAAALACTGTVAAHEAFHQLLLRDVQRIAGYVFQCDHNLFPLPGYTCIHPRSGLSIFCDVAKEVIEHAPKQAAVRQNKSRFTGRLHHGRKAGHLEAFHIFRKTLPQQLHSIGAPKLNFNVPCCGF